MQRNLRDQYDGIEVTKPGPVGSGFFDLVRLWCGAMFLYVG